MVIQIRHEQSVAFTNRARADVLDAICQEFAADPGLVGGRSARELRPIVEEAVAQAGAVGLDAVGSVAVLMLLSILSDGDPDRVPILTPILGMLRDVGRPESARLREANRLLDEFLQMAADLHARALAKRAGSPG